jgi:hypothetical protein
MEPGLKPKRRANRSARIILSTQRRPRNNRPCTAPGRSTPSLAHRRDVFQLRAEARAILVAECEMDFHEAVDGLQAVAVAYGLVAELGQDAVQAILAEAFAKVPRAGELEDAIAATADFLNEFLIDIALKPRSYVPRSTIDAVSFLIKQNDPQRLRTFLAKHTAQERMAIRKHFERRK